MLCVWRGWHKGSSALPLKNVEVLGGCELLSSPAACVLCEARTNMSGFLAALLAPPFLVWFLTESLSRRGERVFILAGWSLEGLRAKILPGIHPVTSLVIFEIRARRLKYIKEDCVAGAG